MLNLRTPPVGLAWLPKFGSDIVALFKSKMAAPFWLWSAATADLPTTAGMGANEGALAYDDTLNKPTFYDGSNWSPLSTTAGTVTTVSVVTANGFSGSVANPTTTPAITISYAAAALTKTDDTNVTLTLGGSPTVALLAAASITLGWSGTLAVARGGTGGANAADARTNLGLVIGTNVQAWSSNLDEYAAVNPTAAGLALLDDADAAAQRTTLGLGTAAVVNTGTSGATLGLLSTDNLWGAYQRFGAGARVEGSSSPASGEGIEFSYTGGAGAVYAYDRTGGAYKPMTYGGLTVTLQVNGTNIAAPTATGFEPATDNTFYLGRNDDDTPKAWKGLILKDQAGTGKYYRLEVNNNALLLVDLTD